MFGSELKGVIRIAEIFKYYFFLFPKGVRNIYLSIIQLQFEKEEKKKYHAMFSIIVIITSA